MKIKGYEMFIIVGVFVLALITISTNGRELKEVKNKNDLLISHLDIQNELIDSLLQEIDSLNSVITIQNIAKGITATMYHPTPEQCDDTPNITADGSEFVIENASWYKWIAVSQDLIYDEDAIFSFNDKVAILNGDELLGVFKVKDVMNRRWEKRIDFLETPGTPIYEYKNVTLVKL